MNAALKTERCQAIRAVMLAAVVVLVPGCLAADDGSAGKETPWRLGSFVDGAKLLREGAPFWQFASRNGTVPAGSNLEIPEGGGFSRSDIGAVTAQSLARFELPSTIDARPLHHVQGNVRYDIERRFDVTTPQLSLSAAGAVFDVIVDVHGTQIDAISGRINVITSDRVSEVRLQAGESARVSSTNLAKLQVRSAVDPDFVTVAFGLGGDSSSDEKNGFDGDRQSPPSSEPSDPGRSPATNDGGNDSGGSENDSSNEGKGSDKGKGSGKGKGSDKSGGKGKGKK